jgi:hypothetical protein
MTSKPEIVRRAVAEGLKAADPRHGPLDPKVVALDALLQVLADIMERVLR